MVSKIYKITLLLCLVFYCKNIVYAKTFDENKVYNYFSALVSLEKNKSIESLNYFNSSKELKESHLPYIKKYVFSLVLGEKISKAISEIKITKDKKFIDFYEAQLLLVLDGIKKKDYKKSLYHLSNLEQHEEEGTFDFFVTDYLSEYINLFKDKKNNSNLGNKFGKISLINKTLQKCYLGDLSTEKSFENLNNYDEEGSSRYLFFYSNYLISQKKFLKAKDIFKEVDPINSTLLIAQAKQWIDKENYDAFTSIFSCKNPNDIIAEFLFIVSTLYSSGDQIDKSNFYFNLSNYLNPKFKFNLALLADNYFQKEEFSKVKKILKKFNKKNEIYYWYRIKKIAQIIVKEKDKNESFKYINNKFNDIEKPSLKITYEMGNVAKGFEKYDLSIKYYTKVLSKLDPNSIIYPEVLFRRGGSYERIGNEKKSDEDLLKSLSINPDDPHVLNYLAYSWLERNYKIDTAIDMLEKAYNQKPDDPYIIDSIGWAYYLTGNYIEAEKLLRKAVQIMPEDPIVNDHYGDILWKLGRKTQANYFWNNVLTLEDVEEKMKEDIFYKLLKGPNNT
tara:strand:- start:902 stop:2581 length:1680 start_codon:yes stop_codon:yes gene_type:complete